MPRLMKCRLNDKGRRNMQKDGYLSRKYCPCGRRKYKMNRREKQSQKQFLMKHVSKGNVSLVYDIVWLYQTLFWQFFENLKSKFGFILALNMIISLEFHFQVLHQNSLEPRGRIYRWLAMQALHHRILYHLYQVTQSSA